MPIDIVISANNHKITVRVRGDVDSASVDDLSNILGAAEDAQLVVVDLSASPFVDIPGVQRHCGVPRLVGAAAGSSS